MRYGSTVEALQASRAGWRSRLLRYSGQL